MVWHDQMSPVTDEQIVPGDFDSLPTQILHLGKQCLRIDHNSIADNAGLARMRDSRWYQMKHELLLRPILANDHCVSGIMPALIARHDVKVRRYQVDDLAFSFVSPLRTYDCEVHFPVC